MGKIESQVIGHVTLDLQCALTDAELRARGDEIARLHGSRDELRERKKALTHDLNAEIGKVETEILSIVGELRTRKTERKVKCEEVADFASGVVTVVRTDTGEVVSTRPIRADERQKVLPIRPVRKADDQP